MSCCFGLTFASLDSSIPSLITPFYTVFTWSLLRRPISILDSGFISLTSLREQQHLSVICLSHPCLVIPEERPGGSSDHSSPALWEAQEGLCFQLLSWFVAVTSERQPCQRLCSTRVAHAAIKLALKKKNMKEPPGPQASPCYSLPSARLSWCRDQRRTLPRLLIPCGQIPFGSDSTGLEAEGPMLCCSLPAVLLSAPASPCLKLAPFCQAGWQPFAQHCSLGAPPKLTQKEEEWI